MGAAAYFRDLIGRVKKGQVGGLVSVCSAHRFVVRAAMEQARDDGVPALIESTVNQVNQEGGYTGMTPCVFRDYVLAVADHIGFPRNRLILGGDHVGPYPWRMEPAETAMAKACRLVADSVCAGYSKIHLDATMPLGDDSPDPHAGLAPELMAEREAQLALAAETAYRHGPANAAPPVYVIGTDVPPPGGIQGGEEGLYVTSVAEFETTVHLCRDAFLKRGLEKAWERVVAVVVQPGVEFGDQTIHDYDRARAAGLCAAAKAHPTLALEGHSTDYQTPESLRQLVEDGVAVLKVGPALTFAMREGLFLLEMLERHLPGLPPSRWSGLADALDKAMVNNSAYWQTYYGGNRDEQRFARRFSLSDRCRYYWSVPEVEASIQRLFDNLRSVPIPYALVSQYLPHLARRLRSGEIAMDPEAMVRACVRRVLGDYAFATRAGNHAPAGASMRQVASEV